jgi:uncharacterized membrane protein
MPAVITYINRFAIFNFQLTMNLPLRLRAFWDDLRTSLWFRPALGILLAVVGATLLLFLDQSNSIAPPEFFRIGADSARAVLTAIAGAMLAVVGLVFSILMVALVLASQQFSPRILRNFVRDPISQNVLGVFVAVFVYSLLVLARISEREKEIFTPVFSVTGSILLAMLAIGVLIYFIDHITRTIRVSYIIADINRQTENLLDDWGTATHAQYVATNPDQPARDGAHEVIVTSLRAGYLQAIDYDELVQAAQTHDVTILLERMVGDFVTKDGVLLRFWPATPAADRSTEWLRSTFDIGTERTMFDDVLFGFRQLVDIALKAISPAVNDPTTAVNCIDYLTNILIQVAHCPDNPIHYRDENGILRVICRKPTFDTMLDLAFDQLRHYSRAEVTITLRLLAALTEIAAATEDTERQASLWRHANMIRRNVDQSITEPLERQKINECLQQLASHLGQPTPAILLNTNQ